MASSYNGTNLAKQFSQEQIAILQQLKAASLQPQLDADAATALLRQARLDAMAAAGRRISAISSSGAAGGAVAELNAMSAAWERYYTSMETQAGDFFLKSQLKPGWMTSLAKLALEAAITAVLSALIDAITDSDGALHDLLEKVEDACNQVLEAVDEGDAALRAALDNLISAIEAVIALVGEALKTLLEAVEAAAEALLDLL